MATLLLSQRNVRRLLPMNECIEVMEQALRALARGDADQPLRSARWLPDRSGLVGVMPGYLGEPRALGIKALTIFPGNHACGVEGGDLDSHQGAVLFFDPDNGSLAAVLDASEITAVRTAAVSGVATRRLAREEAAHVAILGAGTQARTHIEAMRAVRDVTTVRVWSRDATRTQGFAERESARHGIPVTPASTADDAVANADIICTTTGASDPILRGASIAPGTHINAVGACLPTTRELDTETVARSRLFVDRVESAVNEAGDFLIPRAEGAIRDDHILGEIGDVIDGGRPGRTSSEEVTLFKSLGLAVEDLAAAHHVVTRARAEGIGTEFDFGGRRDAGA